MQPAATKQSPADSKNEAPGGAPAGAARPGRPRSFDMEEALQRAIRVFALRGYHAASISELKAEMGIAPGSLYKAFKDKKAIFLAAFDQYKRQRDDALTAVLATGGSGRQKIERMLRFFAEGAHGEAGRLGCLVVASATELALFDAETASFVAGSLTRNETMFAELIAAGKADGSIAGHVDPVATARLLLCLVQGMRVVGKSGPDRTKVLAVVGPALRLLD